MPAGNSDGGQWTSGAGSSATESQSVLNETPQVLSEDQFVGTSYAANNDARILSDVPDQTWMPGAQSAQYRVRSGGWTGGPLIVNGQWLEPTPGQAVRLTIAEANWRMQVSRAQEIDPGWKPTPSFEETVEGAIANLNAEAKEAEEHRASLISNGIGPGPFAGKSIPARGPERDFNQDERSQINEIGAESGCHTCGTTDPGTSSGNFLLDHQRPSALNPSGQTQRLYPQCLACSRRQGGWVNKLKRR